MQKLRLTNVSMFQVAVEHMEYDLKWCKTFVNIWKAQLNYLDVWLKDAGHLFDVGRSLPHLIPLVILILERDFGNRSTHVGFVDPYGRHPKKLWEANL